MKRRAILRGRRLPGAALALPMLTIPAAGAGLAYAASPQATASSSQRNIAASVKQRRVPYGQDLTVTGRAPSGEEGESVNLLFRRAGSSDWHRIDSARIGRRDGFRFHTELRWSGAVKVAGTWPASAGGATGSGSTKAMPASDTSGTTHAASTTHRVAVAAVLHVGRHAGRDMGGHRLTVRGTILPRARGRQIRLEAYSANHWHTAAVAKTGSQGRFRLNFTPHARTEWLRVRFGGNRSNASASRRAGRVTVFSQGAASWYDDGGTTACGYHATYGVANVSLPCGTKVTFVYNGRSVTATVDDRGPYVGGREWDLNQNTAGALGFSGVADVWASR
jgi:rare lipoprotein A